MDKRSIRPIETLEPVPNNGINFTGKNIFDNPLKL